MAVRVFDADGNEKSWQWAVDRYGVDLVQAQPYAGAPVYRLIEARQKIGPCGMTIKVVNEEGQPIKGVLLLQGWTDGEQLPEDAAPRISPDFWAQPYDKPNRGNGGFTNDAGVFGWGWGPGEQYQPPNGPHWYWVVAGGEKAFTDVVLGLGWLWGTDHDTLDLTFIKAEGGEEPEPEPDELLEVLRAILAEVRAIHMDTAKVAGVFA